ncbi:MAG: penicillin-binding protein 1A [Rhodospirillales bacterium]|nr:MAG: penicillin-binding protein 1A [Rhodospirillales bacterium]
MGRLLKFVRYCLAVFLIIGLAAGGAATYAIWHFSRDLPDHRQLADYQPKISTRVHAGDGQLITEFATEKRTFVPISAVPLRVKQAFIAAEDQRFYQHKGVDPVALARAVVTNLRNLGTDRRLVGGSTITQQVAKNFLVGNERSYERKIREALIAIEMEKVYSKDEILELYLNEIYLGIGAYGVAAAALHYFNKSMDELSVAEAAYLAALPKAPGKYHPVHAPDLARERRDWVIGRMVEEGFLDAAGAQAARAERLEMVSPDRSTLVAAAYFVEEVRRELVDRFGEDALYEGGLSVRTTLSPRLQAFADAALRNGLIAYDRRHGWRGPLNTLVAGTDWVKWLEAATLPEGARGWALAVVLSLEDDVATIGLRDGATGTIPLTELAWAQPWMPEQELGPEVQKAADVLGIGDVVLVEPVMISDPDEEGNTVTYPDNTYGLRQVPDVNGAIIALDPHTGRVLAMSGGYDFALSEFNRATQAWRQPGSAFKPFVYLSALDKNYTPATVILDAPFVMERTDGKGKWKPTNYSDRFYGPSTMRIGIVKSRNLMTVRLAKAIGMVPVIKNAKAFGIVDEMPGELAMALGAGETTLMRLTAAYAMLANGGKRITPTLIDRVQDRTGRTIFTHDSRPCEGCMAERWALQPVPFIPDEREQVADPISAYQIVSMLQGVVQSGTGYRVSSIGKPLAGKTGTTNNSQDAWFLGFSPDFAAGVYVGFDTPRTLGRRETGSSAGVPIFKEFMANALADKPAIPFRVPPGIRMVRMNTETGLPAGPADDRRKIVLEAFRRGTEPGTDSASIVIDGSDTALDIDAPPGADAIPTGQREPPKPVKKQADTGLY